MTQRVPREKIEELVGTHRHVYKHIARAVTAEQTVYIMHPTQCLDVYDDLRECLFSAALDAGLVTHLWEGWEDSPVEVCVYRGDLLPVTRVSADRKKE